MSPEKSGWETLSLLQDALKASLTSEALRQQFLYVKATVAEITSRGSVEEGGDRITEAGSILFLRCIIQPYSVKTFNAKSKICGSLARCLLWFLRGITEEMADTIWSILLRNKQYMDDKCSVDEVLKKPKRSLQLETESAETSVAILVELLTIDGLAAGNLYYRISSLLSSAKTSTRSRIMTRRPAGSQLPWKNKLRRLRLYLIRNT